MKRMSAYLVLVVIGIILSRETGSAEENVRGYRVVPALCLPCGAESYLAITSISELKQLHADMVTNCGESRSAAVWHQKVVQAGVDFDKEALIIMYEVIGTGGTATLDIEGPISGVLKVAMKWNTPKGPAVPIATAACFSLAVDKSIVKRVEVSKGGVLNRHLSGPESFDISR
jgi:hypothetical protein